VELDSYSVAGYLPDSYPIAGAARGTMSDKGSIRSALYGGAVSDYWLYCNAGLDTGRGAPLMVWLDGGSHVGNRDWRGLRMQTVTDNLVHLGRIPPMVHLLINPGHDGPPQPQQYAGEDAGAAMRSLQYDTVSDLFARHIAEEVLPEVGARMKLRADGYSHAVAGQSSGGTACFKLGWFRPGLFSRVMPSIAGFTALGVQPADGPAGGFTLPYLVRREERRNLRVWLSESSNGIDVAQDGRRDMYLSGSWPLANIAMAQALKTRGYDFHFRFGTGYHNMAQQGLDLPEALTWLWRGYDPARTSQTFEQDTAERARPLYRVGIVNRSAW
jgi:enterochelin esterase-like enzyme